MALTRIRQQQILHLEKDLQAIKEQIKTFKEPVDLIANLPIEENNDGDLRVCLEDSNIYIWNEDNQEWTLSSGKNSFSVKTSSTTINTDNQKEIDTNISIEDGKELESDTINVYLNGLIVDKQSYEVKLSNNKIIITWLDSEPLLKNDVLLLQYFEIEMSGASGGSSNTYSKTEIDEKIDDVQNSSTKSIMLNDTKYDTIDGTITLPKYPTSLPADGGNADTVNGLTVETAVPANAKFTDTIYNVVSETNDGLMSKEDKIKLDSINVGGSGSSGGASVERYNLEYQNGWAKGEPLGGAPDMEIAKIGDIVYVQTHAWSGTGNSVVAVLPKECRPQYRMEVFVMHGDGTSEGVKITSASVNDSGYIIVEGLPNSFNTVTMNFFFYLK